MLGLFVTQMADVNHTYPISVYGLLLSVTTISALAGVFNDHLLKSTDASIHACNIVLYLLGVAFNLGVYLVRRFILYPLTEPGFFQGYARLDAVLLILLNACVGIVITFVYKYAHDSCAGRRCSR